METRANYVLVGSFVLVMVVSLLVFVVWFGKVQFEAEAKRFEIVFTGSVTGLSAGSPVRYSGVRVGEVRSIRLDEEDPGKVDVIIEVAADTPIREDTVARLEIQGLTGGLYVLLGRRLARLTPADPKAGRNNCGDSVPLLVLGRAFGRRARAGRKRQLTAAPA